MKRSLALAVILASGIGLSATAQSTAPSKAAPAAATASSSRLAVIAFQAAVTQSNEFQRDYADLQKKYDPRREHLKTESDQIDAMTKQLQAESTLSDAQRTARAGDIDSKKKLLQRDVQDAETDFQQDMQNTFNAVAQKVGQEMTSYAQLHGYSVVLDASQQNSPILYAVDAVNITKPVLDAYNVKSGIPAPPAAPAAEPRTGAAPHSARPSSPQQ